MINIPKNSKIKVLWKHNQYDFSKSKKNELEAKFAEKYGVNKSQVTIVPQLICVNKKGEEINPVKITVDNLQNPQFQLSLFKRYLNDNDIIDTNFELIETIDKEINSYIDYDMYEKNKRYKINWIKWDNFLSYGDDNYFDFRTLEGLVLLNGDPANQSGKTTFAIDLIHFLLFGKTTKSATLDKVFNKHLPEATKLIVEGSLTIEGQEYIIKRKLSRTSLEKRTSKSRTTQEIEYYKVINGELVELEDVEDLREESSIKTNKAIKEAVGNEADFDMIISTTSSNLDELIEKKETERFRLLSRWLGLLPIEKKDELARKKYNEEVKPYLLSNRYNVEELKQENKTKQINNDTLSREIESYKKENENLDNEIKTLNKQKETLLTAKRTIDENVLKLDINTLEKTIEKLKNDGLNKRRKLNETIDEIGKIGDVDYSKEELSNLNEEKGKLDANIENHRTRAREKKQLIDDLTNSEFCPTCKRKYDNVDNSERIAEITKEREDIIQQGINDSKRLTEVNKRIEELNKISEDFDKKAKLETERAAYELNLVNLTNAYKEAIEKKKQYQENKEAIDINNKIDIEISLVDNNINSKSNTKDTNNTLIGQKEKTISVNTDAINKNNEIIDKINQEVISERHWKIYLDMVGKNGISKMVLRNSLPIINAQVNSMLANVCDFTIEIEITDKNDIMFHLIKDGVKSDLTSGSGFERTAAALALRTVLGTYSSLSKPNLLILDEIWGRVAKENYDNMKTLCEQMLNHYDFIIQISHLDEIKDWHDHIITVTKNNNISKINIVR